MSALINNVFMQFPKRAETNQRNTLLETFVDNGPLVTLLSTRDHQIIYGRRGTGKTHALSYLAQVMEKSNDIVLYTDLRTIGSTGGLYANPSLSLCQRATRLLADVLTEMHDIILQYAVERAEVSDLSFIGPILDQFADEITNVEVVGNIETEALLSSSESSDAGATGTLSIDSKGALLKGEVSGKSSEAQRFENRRKESGSEETRIHFGSVGTILQTITSHFAPRRIWVLLDEWSSLPMELQPFLADFLRRTIFPISGATVKIGAIEQRSLFRITKSLNDYIGIELGADASADLNLDDFMVFDNDAKQARDFFQELLFKHYKAIDEKLGEYQIRDAKDLIRMAFSQINAFDEFVRSAEGVPRDAINILSLAAQQSKGEKISVNHVRKAARAWYQRDKEAAVRSNRDAYDLLHWVIDKVIGERRARAFLLRSNESDALVNFLYDARLVHILKRSISAHDQPGIRYDAYKMDYGSYVDLITTSRNPEGNFPSETDGVGYGFLDVPPDDYRSIRRAILDLKGFHSRLRFD
jgi:hypothetical protein